MLGLLALAGCAVGPNYVAPELAMPDTWHQQLSRGLAEGDASLQTWWTLLEDPQLVRLVERAVKKNLDLRQALARVDQARARRGIARGEFFPGINATADYLRSQLSKEVFRGLPQAGKDDDFWSAGLDGSWEVDLFGRIRRSTQSADAGLQASTEDYRDVLVSVLAEVALNYVDVRTFQLRIQFAEQNIETQRGALQLTIDRNRAGLVGDLDVRQAEENLASTEAFLPLLRFGLAQAVHRLGVLLGEYPYSLYAELAEPKPIPSPPERVLVGLPTELVRQRPDIRRAERELAAQTAQIGVATADLYPRFALLGTFAFDALKASKLFTGDATAFSVGPSVRWNLFDGGRVRANIQVQEARTDELMQAYEQTVLGALEEVENSMVAYVQERERRDALARSALAARQAVELVMTLYRTGLTDFQNVLDTQRSQFVRDDELAASEGRVTQDLVGIYRALGGGWAP